MQISLFGKKFEIKARAPAPPGCVNCNYGIVEYVKFKNGQPYTCVGRCNCPLGQNYHWFSTDPKTGKRVKCVPSWPIVSSDDVRILDHNNYPRSTRAYEELLAKEEAPKVPKTGSLLGKEANNR